MTPTIPFIKEKFDEYNRMMFDGKLPDIPIRLSNAKGFLGMCCFKKKRIDGQGGELRFRAAHQHTV